MQHSTLPTGLPRGSASKFRSVRPFASADDKNFTRWQYLLLGFTVVSAVVLMTALISVHVSHRSQSSKGQESSAESTTESEVTSTVTSEVTSTGAPEATTTLRTNLLSTLATESGDLIRQPFIIDDLENDPPDDHKPLVTEKTTVAPEVTEATAASRFGVVPVKIEEATKELKELADEMASNMDRSVKPCDDFYEYACGSFRKKYPLFNNKTEVNYFSLHEDRVYSETVRRLLSDELESEEIFEPVRYVKRIWDSCVEDESSTSEQMKKLSNYLKELDKLNSWQQKFIKLTKDGYNTLFTVRMNRVQYKEVHVGPPKFEFDEAYSTEASSPLLDYYTDLIELYKDERDVELAKEIMDFEHLLASNAGQVAVPIRLIILQLNQQTGIQWHKVLNTFIAYDKFTGLNNINVDNVQYVKKFEDAIDDKDVAFWKDYFKVKVMQQSCFYLGKECRAVHLKLAKSINKDLSEEEIVQRTCFNSLNGNLENLLFKVREPQRVLEDPLNYYTKMTNDLGVKLKEVIGQVTWMDGETKKKSIENLLKASTPKEVRNPRCLNVNHLIESKYLDAPLILDYEEADTFDYFSNLIEYSKRKEFEIQEQKSRSVWPVSLFSTKPFIAQEDKSLYIPDFFTTGPFVAADLPGPIKLGALGSLLAHEMTHSFDAVAASFDEIFSQKNFWTEKTSQEFKKKMKCLVDTFDTPVDDLDDVEDVRINSSSTLNENLADFIGLHVAYETFAQSKKPRTFDLPSPLDKMTQEQLFFLSYASVHCATEKKPQKWTTLVETPRKYRVNVVLAHTEKFARAFKCRSGTRFNPKNKCSFK